MHTLKYLVKYRHDKVIVIFVHVHTSCTITVILYYCNIECKNQIIKQIGCCYIPTS